MRYIDADSLLIKIKAYRPYMYLGEDALSYAIKMVELEPSADVRENVQLDVCPLYGGVCGYPSGECYDCPRHGNFRENVRGEWEEIEVIAEAYDISGVKTWASKMKCDQCGFTTIAIEGHFSQYNFCPNCGCLMKGEDE